MVTLVPYENVERQTERFVDIYNLQNSAEIVGVVRLCTTGETAEHEFSGGSENLACSEATARKQVKNKREAISRKE